MGRWSGDRRRALLLTGALGVAWMVLSGVDTAEPGESATDRQPAAIAASFARPAAGPAAARSVGVVDRLDHVEPRVFGASSYPLDSSSVACVEDLSAATMAELWSNPVGPVMGLDNAHVYHLGADRWLWLFHDAFMDYHGTAENLREMLYLNNVGFVQVGGCFSLLTRRDGIRPVEFELGDERVGLDRFFWPLGGEVHDGVLWVFWAEMVATSEHPPPLGDGLSRHPIGTWLASYDVDTLERLSFEPAPNAGVHPQYGFAVASDATHSYLFGNDNMLNLERSGGFLDGPHPSVDMFVARVERGRLDQQPEYYTGAGWSGDASRARAISSRFWAENTMQPRYLDGRWVSVAKVDGFWGDEVVIDIADHAWGPWRTVERFVHEPAWGLQVGNSYQPVLLPWRDPYDGSLLMVISENALIWEEAVADPALYRPAVVPIAWPRDAVPGATR